MKKKLGSFASFGIGIGIMLGLAIVAYAITSLITSQSEKSPFTPKTVFQADLSTGMQASEIGPGDSVFVNPTIYNDATEEMYVFIIVEQPTFNDANLYTYTVADTWKLISDIEGKQIYAYACDGEEMTVLMPGETTEPLTNHMTMQSITNADFSQIEDINFIITAYEIGTEDVPTDPAGAWAVCQEIGHVI